MEKLSYYVWGRGSAISPILRSAMAVEWDDPLEDALWRSYDLGSGDGGWLVTVGPIEEAELDAMTRQDPAVLSYIEMRAEPIIRLLMDREAELAVFAARNE